MTDSSFTVGDQEPVKINTGVAHSARIWNHWLGVVGRQGPLSRQPRGRDYMLALMPDLVDSARADRAFLGRSRSCCWGS